MFAAKHRISSTCISPVIKTQQTVAWFLTYNPSTSLSAPYRGQGNPEIRLRVSKDVFNVQWLVSQRFASSALHLRVTSAILTTNHEERKISASSIKNNRCVIFSPSPVPATLMLKREKTSSLQRVPAVGWKWTSWKERLLSGARESFVLVCHWR